MILTLLAVMLHTQVTLSAHPDLSDAACRYAYQEEYAGPLLNGQLQTAKDTVFVYGMGSKDLAALKPELDGLRRRGVQVLIAPRKDGWPPYALIDYETVVRLPGLQNAVAVSGGSDCKWVLPYITHAMNLIMIGGARK